MLSVDTGRPKVIMGGLGRVILAPLMCGRAELGLLWYGHIGVSSP